MFVYWIYLDSHVDPLIEGYIGISQDPHKRFATHKYTTNAHLKNAFTKYGDRINMSIILEDTEQECLAFEHRFRPARDIGWNIAEGGGRPPKSDSARAKKIAAIRTANGYKQSEETIRKRIETRKRNGTYEGYTYKRKNKVKSLIS